MYAAGMRCMLLVVLGLVACSKDTAKQSGDPGAPATPSAPPPSNPVSGKVLTGDQVCNALTPDEVEAELHVKTIARMLPKAGEYGAPRCGWFKADGPDAPDASRLSIAMFIHDNAADSKQYFAKKLDDMCNLNRRMGAGSGSDAGSGSGSAGSGSAGSGSGSGSGLGGLEFPDLGDAARFCGGLWVLKGRTFFDLSLGRNAGTRDERFAAARHLAERVLPRLP
jgi:hypothetical protein